MIFGKEIQFQIFRLLDVSTNLLQCWDVPRMLWKLSTHKTNCWLNYHFLDFWQCANRTHFYISIGTAVKCRTTKCHPIKCRWYYIGDKMSRDKMSRDKMSRNKMSPASKFRPLLGPWFRPWSQHLVMGDDSFCPWLG
jgi:hypothetical protein